MNISHIKPVTENIQKHDSLPEHLPGFDLTEGTNRVAGNTELYKKLLLSFYKNNGEKAEQIKQAVEVNDFTLARQLTHSIKGVSGNLSAKQLFEAARNLEFALKQKSRENLTELLDQFETKLSEVMNSLAFLHSLETIEANTASDNKAFDKDSISENIKELAALLDGFHMKADKSFLRLCAQLSQQEFKESLHKLENAINDLEFDTASKILSELANLLNIKI